MYKLFLLAPALLLAVLLCTCDRAQNSSTDTVFTRLDPDSTGINFTNQTGESDSFNILTNEYIYNGGGVGVGDFDQDGRPDAFFTGSDTENKLYLNRGDWQFEDVSATAGIGGGNRWNNGVTIADVNNDGMDDIYVCATTRDFAAGRANQLFINQGNNTDGIPTFTDMAADWGIADTSHNTQAAWLDFDRDGDLDLFLLVNKMVDNKRPNDFNRKVQDGSGLRTDKLYRQDQVNGQITFVEVGKKTGILFQGFALAVTVCDLNRDGWPDLYVSNDYLSNDLVYLNTERDGQRYFVDVADQITKHTSYSAMGNDVADVNNDGLPDIIAVDMLPADNQRRKMMLTANNYNYLINLERFGYHPQFTRNTLQVSQGLVPNGELAQAPRYGEVAMQAGIPATDWSWTPLVADFDLDGNKDIIVTNGFPRDITDKDFGDYNAVNARFFSVEELLKKIPSIKIPNVAFRATGVQDGVPHFEEASKDWGIDVPSFSNGAAYADFDGDGDLDYMVNNIYDPAHVYRNNTISGKEDDPTFIKLKKPEQMTDAEFWGSEVTVRDYYVGRLLHSSHWHPHRGYLSSSDDEQIVSLNGYDTVMVTLTTYPEGQSKVYYYRAFPGQTELTLEPYIFLPDTVEIEEKIEIEPGPNGPILTPLPSPDFTHIERDYIDFNVQPMLLRKMTQEGPALAVTDWNGDGIEDVYVSGSYLEEAAFLQGTGEGFTQINSLFTEAPDLQREETDAVFFDADGDGDDDFYVVNGGYEFTIGSEEMTYQDRLYENTGGRYTLVQSDGLKAVEERSGSTVQVTDYDGDGDLDLFIGVRVEPHAYPKPVQSYFLRNESSAGQLNFVVDVAATAAVASASNVTDALFTDYDGDGDDDLLISGEWSPLRLYANDDGTFSEVTEAMGLDAQNGWWYSLAAGDFDNDGDIDYLAGNLGTNTIFCPTPEEPVTAILTDLDNNGGLDFIPFCYLEDTDGVRRNFPYFNRNDFAKQVTKVKGLHKTHQSYAAATAETYVSEGAEPWHYKVDHNQSVYLENTPEGFRFRALPAAVQSFPVHAILPMDLNGDDFLDALVIGNDHGAETAQGFMDAGNGVILVGSAEGSLTTVKTYNQFIQSSSDFYVPGQGRDLVMVQSKGRRLVVAAQNSGPLVVFGLGARGSGPSSSVQ